MSPDNPPPSAKETPPAGLSPQAYEAVDGDRYPPYVPKDAQLAEFTFKAVVFGILFGIVFGAANAYLGLRVGLTISTSIPVAVLTVLAFRLLRLAGRPGTILESNISQSIGSASSSVASGIIFVLPAAFMWGYYPGPDVVVTWMKMFAIGAAGGILGVLFMVPLRRFLIKGEHGTLPYPEGTACAEVLVAGHEGSSQALNVLWGLLAGAVFRAVTGFAKLFEGAFHTAVPGLKKGEFAIEASPALLGVGYILGYRVSAIMVGGAFVSWFVLIPLIATFGEGWTQPFFPEQELLIAQMEPAQIWNRYVRYIGAGAVACGGLITLARSIPTIIESFRVGFGELRRRVGGTGETAAAVPRTDRDLSLKTLGIGIVLTVLFIAAMPHILGTIDSFAMRLVGAVLIAVFAFFFVTVSARIVGLVGVTSNPTSGMILATLLGTTGLFLLLGWTDANGQLAAISIGSVVGIAASIAGDTSQDLKTGFLLGATPRRQQIGEIIGVLTSVGFVCATVLILHKTYGFGGIDIPAPQAMLMKLVVEGVLSQSIPWGLVLIGASITGVVALFGIPPLAFAVGIYLPLSTMTPIFVGGLIRAAIERSSRHDKELLARRRESGILFGSGLVGGEGLMGVGIALFALIMERKPEGIGDAWLGPLAHIFPLIAFSALALLLYYFTRPKKTAV